MDAGLRARAEAARGFMPADEGLALHDHGRRCKIAGPFLEVGSYCGKSAIYLGAAARLDDRILYSLDHHRGSEENQPGWEWHEPDLVDPELGLIDTLPSFRRTIFDAGLERTVVAVVGESTAVASSWSTELALLFIDGGHGSESAHADYEGWSPKLAYAGLLLIHDVFPDPADGGRPPYEIYLRALEDGFIEVDTVGSLRVLEKR